MPADRLESEGSWEIGRGDEDESEIFSLREKLDGEILPTKVITEPADDGRAHRKPVKRGLGNNDGNLPFWKQQRIPTFCETRYHHGFVSEEQVTHVPKPTGI